MPEDRLAVALTDHPAVGRLLVCDPYRSVAGPRPGQAAAASPRRPSLRARPTACTGRCGCGAATPSIPPAPSPATRRACAAPPLDLGLERPAVITAHPLFAGFGRFDWAGPVTYYGWDDWTASRPARALVARVRGGVRAPARHRPQGVRDLRGRAAARSARPAPARVIPNGIDPEEWRSPGAPPDWFAARPRPRLVYHGSVDSRLDVAQARAVAEAYPEGR